MNAAFLVFSAEKSKSEEIQKQNSVIFRGFYTEWLDAVSGFVCNLRWLYNAYTQKSFN